MPSSAPESWSIGPPSFWLSVNSLICKQHRHSRWCSLDRNALGNSGLGGKVPDHISSDISDMIPDRDLEGY